jgi:hypothetical protein
MFKAFPFWKLNTNKKNKFLPKINRCDLIKAKEYLRIYLGLIITDEMRRKHMKIMSKLNSSQQTFLTFKLFDSSMTNDHSDHSDPNEKINIKGGFLQAIYDGYAEYIFEKPFSGIIRTWGAEKTSGIVEKAKSIYVKYKGKIKKVKTKKELFHLYSEITDFKILDEEYRMIHHYEIEKIKKYIENNINEFAIIDENNSQTSDVDEEIKESERFKKEIEDLQKGGRMYSTKRFKRKLKKWLKLEFDNIEDLEKTLYVLLENTPDTSYTVKLNIDDTVNFDALSGILMTTKKYVKLDLSGSVLTVIPEMAFKQNNFIVGIEIPRSVTSIGSSAFSGCTSLNSVTIPDNVTSIKEYVFLSCTNLTSVTIPNSVTSILTGAFYYCTSLTNVTIPNSVTNIGHGAFRYCYNLTSITIPDSITIIKEKVFKDCTNLTHVTIPESVTEIGNEAFANCTSLKSVIIGKNVRRIGERTFKNCINLNTVDFHCCTIIKDNFGSESFFGNLINKYLAKGPGTYILEWTQFDHPI